MKKLNKLLSVMLSLVMAMSLTTTAWATEIATLSLEEGIVAEAVTLSLDEATTFAAQEPDKDTGTGNETLEIIAKEQGHTFAAYQVFAAEVKDGKMTGAITWGQGVHGSALLTQLQKKLDAFDSCETPGDVARVLAEDEDGSLLKEFAVIAYEGNNVTSYFHKTDVGVENTDGTYTYTIAGVPEGYYLIRDVRCVEGLSAYSAMIMLMSDDGPIEEKSDFPEVHKIVEEPDYNIGDDVVFTLTGTVPNLEQFENYTYIFHDTLSAGLTLQADTVKVYFDDAEVTGLNIATVDTDGCGAEDCTCNLSVAIADLKAVMAGHAALAETKEIKVIYTAALNADAVIGNPGNPNEVYLEYSNDPLDTTSTHDTPKDKVIVYTYALALNKVDQDDAALSGAKFKLKNEAGEYALLDADNKVTGWDADGTERETDGKLMYFIGLDAGTYTLEETVIPDGYAGDKTTKVTIEPTWDNDGNFTGVVGHDDVNDGVTENYVLVVTVTNTEDTVVLDPTGGMGTTLFYAIGGLMSAGAAVMFVTRKRMGEE